MGTYTDSDLVLPARYKIKPITAGQVYSSGGQYEIGDILVDHLTPSNGAGTGYTVEQLAPTVTTDNVEIIYVITGEHPGEYARVEMRSYRPFTYQMILRHRFP